MMQPINSRRYSDLIEEYQSCWSICLPNATDRQGLAVVVQRAILGRDRYEAVSNQTGVPWVFIAAIHSLESSTRWNAHLHNGDPLASRTVHIPAGRPLTGSPPFTWEESALDALQARRLHQIKDWSIPHQLYLLEAYNGLGYRGKGIFSPYLWAGSNLYQRGKYVSDGRFDPNAISKQIGGGLIIKTLREQAGIS